MRLDGRGQTLLTPEDADHRITPSPDGKYFVDSYSTPTTPPVTVLRDANGKVVMPLEKADISRLLASGWKPPTPFTVKARDGKTDIHGLMYTPTRMDSTRKYPIIDYIYPGPQSGSVGGDRGVRQSRQSQLRRRLGRALPGHAVTQRPE